MNNIKAAFRRIFALRDEQAYREYPMLYNMSELSINNLFADTLS